MSSASKLAKFDPTVGSTVDVGIDDAQVPDVTNCMKETAYVAIMTPQGDPFDPSCIWGAPVVYWGLPAVAKSDRVEQAAFEAVMPAETIYPGQRAPEDFAGAIIPYPTGVVIECMLGAVRKLNPLGRGVIFLDEINNATRATEGAMLGFIQKRLVGDVPLAPGIRLIAAANPPKWSTNGFQMSPPTANRFCHFQVKCPPVKQYIDYLISEGAKQVFDAGGTEELIRQKWGAIYGHRKALLAGYLQRQPRALHHEPEPDHPQSGYGWGSPRSHLQAARMAATAEILGYKDDIIDLCIEGCIGEGLAFDFNTWVREADLPRPEEVLQGKWVPDMRRLDVAYAVITSVTQYTISEADRDAAVRHAVGAWSLYQKFIGANMGDMIVSAAQTLVRKNLSRKSSPHVQSVADPVIRWMTDNGLLRYVEQKS